MSRPRFRAVEVVVARREAQFASGWTANVLWSDGGSPAVPTERDLLAAIVPLDVFPHRVVATQKEVVLHPERFGVEPRRLCEAHHVAARPGDFHGAALFLERAD